MRCGERFWKKLLSSLALLNADSIQGCKYAIESLSTDYQTKAGGRGAVVNSISSIHCF